MGAACGKCTGEPRKKNKKARVKNGEPGEVLPDQAMDSSDLMLEDAEETELKYLRDLIRDDLSTFVINNVLLSVQFFKNFEDEIAELRREAKQSDGTILEEHRIKHLQADKLMERIGTRVVFRPRHGPLQNTEKLLHPLRSYLVYQNVSVEHERRSVTYENQEPPFYKLIMEDLEDEKLKFAGFMNLKKTDMKLPEAIYERIDVLGSGNKIDKEDPHDDPYSGSHFPHPTLHLLKASTPDVNYPYSTILSLTATKSLQDIRAGTVLMSSCDLPQHTFKQVKRPVLKNIRRTGIHGPLTVTNVYLKSDAFVSHFWDVLVERLAEPLSIVRAINSAKVQGERIRAESGRVTHYITPVLKVTWWPDEAQEFLRPGNSNDSWPTPSVQKAVKKSCAYLLPLGNLQRHGKDPNFELQWRYITPRAEELLLTYTMHAHLRCYLFTVCIFKMFLESDNTCLGLEHTHILHLLFWEIHKNFKDWPEARPAESLLNFLRVLRDKVKNRKIRDFFIRDRNLLESSPHLFLNKVHGTLDKILQNPLPYIILAMKNIRMRTSFFPEIDYSKVYKLATTDNVLSYLNPNLVPKRRKRRDSDSTDEEDELREYRKEMYKEIMAEKEQENTPRDSVETIDLSQVAQEDNDIERRCELLAIFIDQFISMGRKSREFKAMDQARMYFTYSKILVKLSADFDEDARKTNGQLNLIDRELHICDIHDDPDNDTVIYRTDNDESSGHRLSIHDRELPKLPGET